MIQRHKTEPQAVRQRLNFTPYLFLLPTLLLFAVFMYFPIVRSVLMSFQRNVGGKEQWVGLAQYQRLFGDTIFLASLTNTLIFLLIQVPIMLCGALFVAITLNRKNFPLRGLFRSIYFLPSLMGLVAAGLLFRLLFNEDLGLINAGLHALGLPNVPWFNQPWWARITIMLVMTWRGLGSAVVVLLAGLQAIPEELYEAAELDGAHGWQITRFVTLPMLQPTLVFVTVVSTISVLNMFDEVVTLTNGGPANATMTLGLYLYRTAFQNLDFNYGAALAWVMVILVGVFSALQFFLAREDRQ